MKVPLTWLNEYVDLSDQSVQDVADLLTFSGIEVESIDTDGVALDGHFIVGEVLECDLHPNSDHLHVCKVADGKNTAQVVCGAPNVRKGLKVAFATLGAVMPGDDRFQIKKSKLRGVESFGMLCSKDELGLGGDHSGIWELPESAETGSLLMQLMPPAETVYDLEVTWNRSDCLSVRGVARELAALLDRDIKSPDVTFAETEEPVESLAKVVVTAPELCPRYTARVVTNVNTQASSPEWMVRRLEQCGMRSLGLAIDITNYVMLELGQPLHAFDHTCLADRTIIVRRAREGEVMVTLDEVKRTLDESMLVIADANQASAIAGIMGGLESEIASDTGTILIESALFDPANVKFTATTLGLASESSYRFARSVDWDLADFASRRAVSLLVSLGGGTVCKGMIDSDYRQGFAHDVALTYKRVCEIIGIPLSPDKIKGILTSLGLTITIEDDAGATFAIPSWRYDLTMEADLIEEVTRMNGLDQIPNSMPTLAAVSQLDDSVFQSRVTTRHALLSLGFTEAMHYSFLSMQELNAFDPTVENRLVLPNPVSADYGVMRDSLLPQLSASLGRNAGRQVEQCALFEIGRVFSQKNGKPVEDELISMGMMGPFGRDSISRRTSLDNEEAMLWLKGAIEALATKLHAPRLTFSLIDHPAMEEGFAVAICVGKRRIGMMGALSAQLRHKWRLTKPMVVAEVSLKVMTGSINALPRIKPVPQYPAIRKDLAIIVPNTMSYLNIVKVIREKAPAELTDLSLFDIFTSKALGKDKRSLGLTLEFRSVEKTLKDTEVSTAFAKIIQHMKDKLGVDVREA